MKINDFIEKLSEIRDEQGCNVEIALVTDAGTFRSAKHVILIHDKLEFSDKKQLIAFVAG